MILKYNFYSYNPRVRMCLIWMNKMDILLVMMMIGLAFYNTCSRLCGSMIGWRNIMYLGLSLGSFSSYGMKFLLNISFMIGISFCRLNMNGLFWVMSLLLLIRLIRLFIFSIVRSFMCSFWIFISVSVSLVRIFVSVLVFFSFIITVKVFN